MSRRNKHNSHNMKIEIGESLVYTWLRHVKQCQMVQMNWTPSDLWTLKHQSDLDQIMKTVDLLFPKYAIFGHKTKMPLKQFIAHAEIDVLGSLDLGNTIFAVDVAFHENGLGYGGTAENAARVVKKCLRAAMCIYGYFDKKDAEIIFVSPKIHKKDWPVIAQNVRDLECELNNMGYSFVFKVICDQSTPDFQSEILDPVLSVINNIADTNELFVRSVQLLHMFYSCSSKAKVAPRGKGAGLRPSTPPLKKQFSVNGTLCRTYGEVALEAVRIYVSKNPGFNATQIASAWAPLKVVSNQVETDFDHNARKSRSKDPDFDKRSYEVKLKQGSVFVSNQFTDKKVIELAKKVNVQPWGITIS